MTYKELIDSIRFKVDDEASTRFTAEQLRLAINEAYKHIYRELIRHSAFSDVQSTTVDFVSGSQEIAFDAGISGNIQKILHVRDDSNVPIPMFSEELSKRSGTRSVYFRRTLVSTPADANTRTEKLFMGWFVCPSGTFTITVLYKPKMFEFSSSVFDSSRNDAVPSEHHDVVILRSVVLLLGVDEDFSNLWFNLYQEALKSMVDSIELTNETVDEVVDTETEGYYYARG